MAVPLFLCAILLVISPVSVSSVSDSEALLNFKKTLTNADALSSWRPDSESEPCGHGRSQWEGLVCSQGIVTGLRLGGLGLAGEIDIEPLVKIPGIRTISIVNNSLSGKIPEFNRLGALKSIFLSGNRFSGEIPADFFAKMAGLKKVWLSDNNFSGPIPSSLAKVPNLMELHLENNQFSGELPYLAQTTLVSLNLTNNKLEGEIPRSISRFPASSFAGNEGLCGGELTKHCNPHESTNNSSAPLTGDNNNKKNDKIATAIITIAIVILTLMLAGIVLLKRREEKSDYILGKGKEQTLAEVPLQVRVSNSDLKKDYHLVRKVSSRKSPPKSSNGGLGDLVILNNEKGNFGLQDLMKAAAEVLGNGALGSSYKALMSNGKVVVVKRMKDMNKLGKEGFDAEMGKLGRLKHPNVLAPLAYHYRKEEKLLVYEYVPKGSLLYLLHGDRGPSHAELDWSTRLKIIQGITRGLAYLHSELSSHDLPHGNLKTSNILLTPGHEPLLSDYGFNSLLNSTNIPQALFSYKAPEAAQYQMLSPKCDIYCLGIIILEIITGKFPSQYLTHGQGSIDVVQWVVSAIAEGREGELFDPEIAGSREELEEMQKVLHIGAACTESNPQKRLDMREVVKRIEDVRQGGGKEARMIQVLQGQSVESPAFAIS